MSRQVSVPIPLSPDRWATLVAPVPLSTAEWGQMLATLAAMRPGLVADEQDEDGPGGPPSRPAPEAAGGTPEA